MTPQKCGVGTPQKCGLRYYIKKILSFSNKPKNIKLKNIASNNQIVVALINNESATIKRFFREDNKIKLQPENDFMNPMYFDVDEVNLLGVVTGVFRAFK